LGFLEGILNLGKGLFGRQAGFLQQGPKMRADDASIKLVLKGQVLAQGDQVLCC
jgi:hypothetical protein